MLASPVVKRLLTLLVPLLACNAQGPGGATDGFPNEDAGAPSDGGSPAPLLGTFGGEIGPHFDEVDDNYDALLASTMDYAEFLCECEAGAASGPTFDECVTYFVIPPPPPLLACTKIVYSRSERAASSLSCERGTVDEYMACILESTCLDFDHITDCEIDRIIRAQGCGRIPHAVHVEDQLLCYGRELPPAFVCDDGDSINPAWVCDLELDCADGSDEVDCNPHAGLTPAP